MKFNWKQMIGLASSTIGSLVLPVLESKAAETDSPYDDFAVKAVATFLPLVSDGEIEPEEALDASISLFEHLFPLLRAEAAKTGSPYDDAAVESLYDAFVNFKDASGL